MILGTDIIDHDQVEMIEFYKKNFVVCDVVTCKGCSTHLCLELMGGDPMGIAPDDDGKIRINLSSKLLSYRIRLDETPDGLPMMGYQCECGNDTRIAALEEKYMPESPANKGPTLLDPFTKSKIKEKILSSAHKAKFRVIGLEKHYETFKVHPA